LSEGAGLSGLAPLSGRCRGLGEGDLAERRGRGARGERLLGRGDLARLEAGGEPLLAGGGDRLRRGERGLARRGAGLRLRSRAELRT
jgi:hypothetical protein